MSDLPVAMHVYRYYWMCPECGEAMQYQSRINRKAHGIPDYKFLPLENIYESIYGIIGKCWNCGGMHVVGNDDRVVPKDCPKWN